MAAGGKLDITAYNRFRLSEYQRHNLQNVRESERERERGREGGKKGGRERKRERKRGGDTTRNVLKHSELYEDILNKQHFLNEKEFNIVLCSFMQLCEMRYSL